MELVKRVSRIAILVIVGWMLAFSASAQLVSEALVKAEQDRHNRRASLGKKTNTGLDYDVVFQRLELMLDPRFDDMGGSVTTFFLPKSTSFNSIEFDLSSNMNVDSVLYRGKKLGFFHTTDVIGISFGKILLVNTLDSITVFYHGNPTNNIENSYGREKSRVKDPSPSIWTLSEPYGAPQWWPCKDGLQDKIDSLDMLLTIPKGNKAAGMGVLVSQNAVNDSQVLMHWKHRYPIANYLVGVAVTNYVEFTDTVYFQDGRKLPIVNYIFPEYLSSGRDPARQTVPMMQLFDSLFGAYPFDLEKYGHVQYYHGGGMEHQTMSFMADWNYALVAHELAHQWFGNKVTCGSWSDLWLNEGFATYLTLITYEYLQKPYYRGKLEGSRNSAFKADQGSVYVYDLDTTDRGRLFSSALTYQKGAQVLHMLRWKIGDEAFFTALRDYLSNRNHSYGFAHSNDLMAHFERASRMNLSEFFDDWLYGSNYPHYELTWKQNGVNVELHLKQNSLNPENDFYSIPVPLRFKSASDSMDFRLETQSNDTTFTLPISFNPDTLIFDPDLWIMATAEVVQLSGKTSFTIQPNPVQDVLKILVGDEELEEVLIYSADGKLVHHFNLGAISSTHPVLQFDVQFLRQGAYFVELTSKRVTEVLRFIKL